MTADDHIAAIKEHLKAIEAEKQQPDKYLVIPVNYNTHGEVLKQIENIASEQILYEDSTRAYEHVAALQKFIRSGKIITINEE